MPKLAVQNEIEIKKTGVIINVPKNPTAKCMYYIYCVSEILYFANSEMYNYIDYMNYHLLELSDKKKLLELCEKFDPQILIDKKLFIRVDHLTGTSRNEFFDITEKNSTHFIDETLEVFGYEVKVKKIMMFKQTWLAYNYYNAVFGLRKEISQSAGFFSRNPRIHPESGDQTNKNNSNTCKSCCKCFKWVCGCICVSIVIIIIALVVTGSLTIEKE